jgi:hypothetical protein
MSQTVATSLQGVSVTHKGMLFETKISDLYAEPTITITDESGVVHENWPLRFFNAAGFGLQNLVNETEEILSCARRDLHHPRNIEGCSPRPGFRDNAVIDADDVEVFNSYYRDGFPYLKWSRWGLTAKGIKGKWTLKIEEMELDIADAAWDDSEGIANLAGLLLDRESVNIMAALLDPKQVAAMLVRMDEREAHRYVLSMKAKHHFPTMKVSQMLKIFEKEEMASLDPSDNRHQGALVSVGFNTDERYDGYSTSRKINLALGIISPHTPCFSRRLSEKEQFSLSYAEVAEQERALANSARVLWEERFREVIKSDPEWRFVDLHRGDCIDANTFWITKLAPSDWESVQGIAMESAKKTNFSNSAIIPF